ncbi:MAG: FitA-like ribbon-helix-helix domain-containing protein [Pseudonocardiaceae bacterium]
MPSIQVRHVSSGTHAVLRRRAAELGLSMQEYLVTLLDEFASKPTVEEVLRRAGGRAGGRIGLRQAADELRADRDSA